MKKISMNKDIDDYIYYFDDDDVIQFKQVIVGYRLDFDRLTLQNEYLKGEIYSLREYGVTLSNKLEYKLLKKVPRNVLFCIKSFIRKL